MALISGIGEYEALGTLLGVSAGVTTVLMAVILVWTIIWKGLALWKSARKTHKIWFIILLIVNTLGILEILYIFVFSKMSGKGKTGKQEAKPAVRTKRAKKK